MAEQSRICEWCSREYMVARAGPGRPSPYCSDVCRREAQNARAKARIQRMRERQAPLWGEKAKRGRPPKG